MILLVSGFKVVREAERLVVFRLGRVMLARGPGLVLIVPIVDRAIRVDVPVRLIQVKGGSPHVSGRATTPSEEELQGHPGITVGEVSVRAAIMAVQRDPRTKRATPEDFLAALEAIEEESGRNVW